MIILVTGGAGFIGSHLCNHLLVRGHEVICLDNFFTGSKKNIRFFLDDHDFELIRHDVVNPIALEVDQIYNLACPASPVHYQHNAIKTIKTNVMGMINMLGLAKRVNARILQASTSEVYGDPQVHPQTEDYWGRVNCIGPRACYDEGKRVAETLCMDYYRMNNVDVRIARIFNTYGPNMSMNDGRVVSNFIVQALKNEDITIYGDGTQNRSFCYITDLVTGLIDLMEFVMVTDFGEVLEVQLGPVNLGNPTNHSMLELAETVLKLTQSRSKLVFKSLPQDDPQKRKPDISRAKQLIGFNPTVSLEEGLKETIQYFKSII